MLCLWAICVALAILFGIKHPLINNETKFSETYEWAFTHHTHTHSHFWKCKIPGSHHPTYITLLTESIYVYINIVCPHAKTTSKSNLFVCPHLFSMLLLNGVWPNLNTMFIWWGDIRGIPKLHILIIEYWCMCSF